MRFNDKDCPTSDEMTDAKSAGAGKTSAKRKACQCGFSDAIMMETVRVGATGRSYEQKAHENWFYVVEIIASIRYYLALFVPVNSISFLVIVCIYRPKS